MKIRFTLVLLALTCISSFLSAQDSLFFYKNGKIKYSVSTTSIDSVSLHAPTLYPTLRSNQTLQYLEAQSGTTIFAQMIRIAGMADSLDNKTIWAPTNSALANVNLGDIEGVRKIVKNHIASGLNAITSANALKIEMLSLKKFVFFQNSTNTYIDSLPVIMPGNYVAKSLIYQINSSIPFRWNIWESLTQTSATDLFSQYVLSHNSTSGSVTTNDLLALIPNANNEDSITTVIVPTDEAFTTAYNKLYSYCKGTSASNQDENTKFAIFHNNFIKGAININSGKLTSTSNMDLGNASNLLKSATYTRLSNGNKYTTADSSLYNSSLFNQSRIIEAESNLFPKIISYYTPSVINCPDSTSISNRSYLRLADASTSSLTLLSVQFPIPNTYSRKYNIYCVFVPGSYYDKTDLRPYKVKFTIIYPNSSGNATTSYITSTNALSTSSTAAGTFITDGKTVQKMLVASNVDLPVCNLSSNSTQQPSVSLKVINATAKTVTDQTNYNRNLMIDCVLFEPIP